ncbi:MAG: sugar nucleotide-binding protein [Bacteroidales bacterium]|nr:sugar nucleotide-binding protein [Bacteroidales bacterium]
MTIAQLLHNYIINCAAYTSVDKAEAEPEKAFLNAEVVNNLYKAAVKSDSKLIHISTDYVFNGAELPALCKVICRTLIRYTDSVSSRENRIYRILKTV